MVPETTLGPDEEAIRQDLKYMTARWDELDAPAVFEIRCFKPGHKPAILKYSPDWMDEAVEQIVDFNEMGFNCYVTRNPLRHDYSGSATDADVLASFFLWADCDDPASAGNVYRFDGPKWSAAVTTGRTPAVRVHTYWMLDEACTDMAAWRDMQKSIAAHFGSDRAVVNPSRIMRVGGTVNFPDTKKQEKGYVNELCEIRTVYDEDRPSVSIDQMQRIFGTTPEIDGKTFQVDLGAQPLDRERTAIQALSGNEWNNAVLKLVGSYVRKGLSDEEVHALTDPLTLAGYTVEQTRAEVQNMLDRTRANPKFEGAGQEFTPNFDHAPAPTASDPQPETAGWSVQTAAAFTADFVAPEYLIDGIMQKGRLYTLTAPTGSGKTAVMLYASTAIATGEQFCGLEVEAGDVLFLAGENPDDVRARVIATMEFYGVDPASCRLHFVAGTFSIRADMERLKAEASRLPNLVMIVVDTFAAYFDGEDENSNAQALDFARVVRSLTQIPSKPAVVMPAHPVKGASKTNLAPKGGSSLVNEVDGNLTLWNEGGLISMHWQVKHRGPDFDPLKLELERKECPRLADKNGRIIPTILAKPVLSLRATQIIRDWLTIEDRFLLNLHDAPDLTQRERCGALGLIRGDGQEDTAKISRLVKGLAKQKLIRKFRTKWELTKEGERAVEEIIEGIEMPAEDTE